MELKSPIFQNGAVSFNDNTWSSALFPMMAISHTMRLRNEKAVFACDQETIETIESGLTSSIELLASMIGGLGSIITAVDPEDLPDDALKQIGWLIEGLTDMQGAIAHAASWMRPGKNYPGTGDPEILFRDFIETVDASMTPAASTAADPATSVTYLDGAGAYKELMQIVYDIDNDPLSGAHLDPATNCAFVTRVAREMEAFLVPCVTASSREFRSGFFQSMAKLFILNADGNDCGVYWQPLKDPSYFGPGNGKQTTDRHSTRGTRESGSEAFHAVLQAIIDRNPVDAETMRHTMHAVVGDAVKRHTQQFGSEHAEGFLDDLAECMSTVALGCTDTLYTKDHCDHSDPVASTKQNAIAKRWEQLEARGLEFDTFIALPEWAFALTDDEPEPKPKRKSKKASASAAVATA